jgi:hypothetical protein
MWKLLIVTSASLTLAGCGGMFMDDAKSDCAQFGYKAGTAEFDECAKQRYDRKLDHIHDDVSAAGEIVGNEPSASTERRPRYLDSVYIDGPNRICLYDNNGSQERITVPKTQTCPLH